MFEFAISESFDAPVPTPIKDDAPKGVGLEPTILVLCALPLPVRRCTGSRRAETRAEPESSPRASCEVVGFMGTKRRENASEEIGGERPPF